MAFLIKRTIIVILRPFRRVPSANVQKSQFFYMRESCVHDSDDFIIIILFNNNNNNSNNNHSN